MIGEVPGLDQGAVIGINVVAPEAKANRSTGGEVGAATLAMRPRSIPLSGQAREVDLDGVGLDFRHWSLLIGGVFGAVPQLNWAIAVVMAFHGKIADANAVFVAALVLVPGYTAIMLVHQSPCEICLLVPAIATASHRTFCSSQQISLRLIRSRLLFHNCARTWFSSALSTTATP